MTIDECYRFLMFISNKTQSGAVQPANFNIAAQRAQMQLFGQEIKHWQESQEVTDALKNFLVTATLNVPVTTGQVGYPADYAHTSTMGAYYAPLGKEVPVMEVDNDEFRSRSVSEVVVPTKRFPIYTYYSGYMQFLPKDISFVMMDYFRIPANPVWGYTVTNGRPVYNPSTSVDFEFPDTSHNDLVFMMCSYLGINIREADLVQYSELMKTQNTPVP